MKSYNANYSNNMNILMYLLTLSLIPLACASDTPRAKETSPLETLWGAHGPRIPSMTSFPKEIEEYRGIIGRLVSEIQRSHNNLLIVDFYLLCLFMIKMQRKIYSREVNGQERLYSKTALEELWTFHQAVCRSVFYVFYARGLIDKKASYGQISGETALSNGTDLKPGLTLKQLYCQGETQRLVVDGAGNPITDKKTLNSRAVRDAHSKMTEELKDKRERSEIELREEISKRSFVYCIVDGQIFVASLSPSDTVGFIPWPNELTRYSQEKLMHSLSTDEKGDIVTRRRFIMLDRTIAPHPPYNMIVRTCMGAGGQYPFSRPTEYNLPTQAEDPIRFSCLAYFDSILGDKRSTILCLPESEAEFDLVIAGVLKGIREVGENLGLSAEKRNALGFIVSNECGQLSIEEKINALQEKALEEIRRVNGKHFARLQGAQVTHKEQSRREEHVEQARLFGHDGTTAVPTMPSTQTSLEEKETIDIEPGMYKFREVIRLIAEILGDLDCVDQRQDGSHVVFRRKGGKSFTLVIPHGGKDGIHSSVLRSLIAELTSNKKES